MTELEHNKLDQIEDLMLQLPQTEIPVSHLFTPGLYLREITIPAGTILTSKIHKQRHPFVVSKGKLSVIENGEVKIIEAPFTGVTEPGTRRIAYAHEDTVWTTFHPTELTSVDEIEAQIIEKRDKQLTPIEIQLINSINK